MIFLDYICLNDPTPLACWPFGVYGCVSGNHSHQWMMMKVEAAAMSCLLRLIGIFRPMSLSARIVVSSVLVLINCAAGRVNHGSQDMTGRCTHKRRLLSLAVNAAIKYFVCRFLLGHIGKFCRYKLVGDVFQPTRT